MRHPQGKTCFWHQSGKVYHFIWRSVKRFWHRGELLEKEVRRHPKGVFPSVARFLLSSNLGNWHGIHETDSQQRPGHDSSSKLEKCRSSLMNDIWTSISVCFLCRGCDLFSRCCLSCCIYRSIRLSLLLSLFYIWLILSLDSLTTPQHYVISFQKKLLYSFPPTALRWRFTVRSMKRNGLQHNAVLSTLYISWYRQTVRWRASTLPNGSWSSVFARQTQIAISHRISGLCSLWRAINRWNVASSSSNHAFGTVIRKRKYTHIVGSVGMIVDTPNTAIETFFFDVLDEQVKRHPPWGVHRWHCWVVLRTRYGQ